MGNVTTRTAPVFWVWMGEQHLHTDPVKAAAAIEIRDRWGFWEKYNHARVLRSLSTEDSPHLYGARALADEYARTFGIAPGKQITAYGAISPLIPTAFEQCDHVNKSGKRCGRDAVPGTGVCGWHGGQWITEAERAEVVREVSGRLVDVADRALRVIVDLMDNARSEKVRGDMALAVLDRIGVGPTSKVELDVTSSAESAADEVMARLQALKAAALEQRRSDIDADIVDAEIVQEPSASAG